MKRLVTLSLAAVLAACAAPREYNVTETQRLRCEYEARRSTAGINNGFTQGAERANLKELCMRLAEAENASTKPSR
jgi:hypothetical protein